MHDDLTGTSLPAAYRYTAADLASALNGCAEILEESIESIVATLDTDTEGEPIAIYNPLGRERTELVDVRLFPALPDGAPPRVFGPDGAESPSQWRRVEGGWRGCFEARVPALAVSIFEARSGRFAGDRLGGSDGRASSAPDLANELQALRIDSRGDLASWVDLRSGRELLASPAGIELLANRSERFPSWEIRYEDLTRAPFARIDAPAESIVVESGPLRRRLRYRQRAHGSTWSRDYVLATGARGPAGAIAEIDFRVDWRTDGAVAKADFPFAWEFPEAIYDLGVGVARRPVSSPALYEAPAQSFAAAPRAGTTHAEGGAVLLSDVKQGWDHPAAHRLRLTLLHTPRIGRRFRYQRRQDFGTHRFRIGLAALAPDDGLEHLVELAERFRQPLRAFRIARGRKGDRRVWSPLDAPDPATVVSALKPSEVGDRLVLRLREASGSSHAPAVALGQGLRVAEELDGGERPIVDGRSGPLERGMRPFELRTVALAFDPSPSIEEVSDLTLDLPRDVHATSDRGENGRSGGLDGRGHTLPRFLLPAELIAHGVTHDLAALHRAGEPSALRARGQERTLPPGYLRLSLLVGSFGRDADTEIAIGNRRFTIRVRDSLRPAGRFDELALLDRLPFGDPVRPGFLHRLPQRWVVPHLHDRRGRIDACRTATLCGFDFPLDDGGGILRLPDCASLLIFAATLSRAALPAIQPLSPLFESERADG
jgi:alpha-mannosidase